MEGISNLTNNLTGGRTNLISVLNGKSPDDVVIVGAYRTALTKAGKGEFKDTPPEILLSHLLRGLMDKTGVPKDKVEDMVVGNCLMVGAGAMLARAAQLMADFPVESTACSINRQCSSGIEACAVVAAKIKAGIIEVGIGAGVESMSLFDMNSMVDAELLSDELFDHEIARNTLQGMGMTAENVAQKYDLKRTAMDVFATESHRRALHAQKAGWFDEEIIPVKTTYINKKGEEVSVTVTKDGGIRPTTTVEKLAKLKGAFGGVVVTAGNSSQTTDGAGAVLLAKRSVAIANKWPIVGSFVTYAVAGVPPEIMGVGPAYAIPMIFEKTGLTKDDIDVFEVNEAFASQATWSCDKLGLDYDKVNPRGGAIALGHPLGCTGARMVATILSELRRTDGKYGIISMCIGTGMGAAALIQRE